MKYNINVIESVWSDWFKPEWKRLKNRWMATGALLMFASLAYAGDANWPMGSPNGGWQMGTPDGSWPMGSGGTVSGAPSVANLSDVRIGFTAEQVLRLLGAPSTMDTTRKLTAGLTIGSTGSATCWRQPFDSMTGSSRLFRTKTKGE